MYIHVVIILYLISQTLHFTLYKYNNQYIVLVDVLLLLLIFE